MTLSIELAHVYRAELEVEGGLTAWEEKLARDSLHVPWHREPVVLLFVDDYPEVYPAHERLTIAGLLAEEAAELDIIVDAVAFESSCASAADTLAESLPLEPGHWFTTNGTGRHTAYALKQDEPGLWTCPALAAIWTLARLGAEPYREAVLSEAVRFTDRFDAEQVMSILPTRYIDVEAAVVEMIRQLRKPRIPLSRVQYVLT